MTWTETKTAGGEVYYFNSASGESSWKRPEGVEITSGDTKPEGTADKTGQLPAANAVAMAKISGSTSSMANVSGSWRELISQDGRKYYMNSVTKATVWEMPLEYREFLERQNQMKTMKPMDRQSAEEQFMQILRDAGVKSDWEWELALRSVIDHPNYKCLPTLQERKEAFARYKDIQRGVEREERYRQVQQAREAFKRMLDEEGRIQAGTRWSEAMEYINEREEYKAISSPRDRVELYEEYIAELKRGRKGSSGRKQTPQLLRYSEILASLPQITVETKWKEAIQIVSESEAFKAQPELQRLEPLDMLIEYESHIKGLEQKEAKTKKEILHMEQRKERLARKEMKAIITGLLDSGQFTALTRWPEFLSIVRSKPCYEEMITAHPSDPTPLDYYWDALDELQAAYVPDRRVIMKAAGPEYPKELRKFTDRVRNDHRFSEIKGIHHIELAFRELSMRSDKPILELPAPVPIASSSRTSAPASVEVDRRLIEAYKHLIKHWKGPAITLDSTYDHFKPHLASHPEFQDLNDELTRRLYFDKYLLHLRKKVPKDAAQPGPADAEPEEGEVIEEEGPYPIDSYQTRRRRSRY